MVDDLRLVKALEVLRDVAQDPGPHAFDVPAAAVTLVTQADRLSFIAGGLDEIIDEVKS